MLNEKTGSQMHKPAATRALPVPPWLYNAVTLMKPVTRFAPAWAWMCGSIASGATTWAAHDLGRLFLGMFLAGPIVCGLSQVVNDYCDREVDAAHRRWDAAGARV
jgi:chlorophyll synthase